MGLHVSLIVNAEGQIAESRVESSVFSASLADLENLDKTPRF